MEKKISSLLIRALELLIKSISIETRGISKANKLLLKTTS